MPAPALLPPASPTTDFPVQTKLEIPDSSRTHVRLGAWFWSAQADIFFSESLHILAEHLSQSEIELPLRNTCYYSPLAEVGVSTQTEMNTPFTCEAIFSDIDGTFLTSEHHVSPKTQEVIRSAIQHGIQFSLISARNPLCIQSILDRIHLSCNIIGCNGALIMNENHKTDCNRTHSGIRW